MVFLAFDLGLDYERDDDQYIKEAIQTIESRFDLVLITDRFEESVILLKGTDLDSLDHGIKSYSSHISNSHSSPIVFSTKYKKWPKYIKVFII